MEPIENIKIFGLEEMISWEKNAASKKDKIWRQC